MDKEEKIMSALETLVFAVNGLAGKVDNIENDITDVKRVQERMGQSIVKIEIEHGQKLGAIFDKLDILDDKTDRNTEAIQRIEERLDMAEINIRVFDTKLRNV